MTYAPALRPVGRRVFAVGSASDDVDSLTDLLGAAITGRDGCFVVARHLAPRDRAELSSVLARSTPLQVTVAVDGDLLVGDTVYLAPPGTDVLVEYDAVRVFAQEDVGRSATTIDRLFASAARAYGVDAIAVLLSGTGDDGVAGIESVRSAGGLVAVQDRSTVTGVDLTLPAARIVPELTRVLDRAAARPPVPSEPAARVRNPVADLALRRDPPRFPDRRAAVLDAVMRTQDIGVLVLDGDDRVLSANAGFSALTGYTSAFLIGTPLTVLLQLDSSDRADTRSAGAVVGRRIVTSDGVARPVTLEIQAVSETDNDRPDAPRAIALVRDIARMREIGNQLAEREHYDLQTGLLTRNHLRSKAAELMASGVNTIALLWIDVDGFKDVNDRFGHRAGDLVLATIATRLHQAAGRHDIVGRLGGDEFALLVTRSQDLHGLDSLALRVLAAIREPIPLHDSLAYVSASVGIAVHPQDAATADELLHDADTAMYVAKDRGRDRHAYFAQEMNAAADGRAAMRQRLGAALSRNDFVMHYQPVVDIATGRVAMIEALVRWRRDGEVVSAAEFIDYAAETGQMRALGRIVLQLVDADITTLHAALGDRQPSVAVNLSVTELDERDITDWLLSWQPAGGLGRIVAEVTESVLLGPDSRALDTLGLLRRLGATISIDDFGTGYSNLELLDRLEPGIIKVDRSLLRRAQEDQRGVNILDAAVQLAHALDAKVVLEGVEDEEMLVIAGEKQADLAQGYHIARPMPVADIIDWIAQRP